MYYLVPRQLRLRLFTCTGTHCFFRRRIGRAPFLADLFLQVSGVERKVGIVVESFCLFVLFRRPGNGDGTTHGKGFAERNFVRISTKSLHHSYHLAIGAKIF